MKWMLQSWRSPRHLCLSDTISILGVVMWEDLSLLHGFCMVMHHMTGIFNQRLPWVCETAWNPPLKSPSNTQQNWEATVCRIWDFRTLRMDSFQTHCLLKFWIHFHIDNKHELLGWINFKIHKLPETDPFAYLVSKSAIWMMIIHQLARGQQVGHTHHWCTVFSAEQQSIPAIPVSWTEHSQPAKAQLQTQHFP